MRWWSYVTDFLFVPPPEIDLEQLPKAETMADGTIAPFEYRHPRVKELVWNIKYKGVKTLAEKVAPLLADTLISELEEQGLWGEEVVLIPVPLSAEKIIQRGWNQAEIIAKSLPFPCESDVLIKVRDTQTQKDVGGRQARLKNLLNSMWVRTPERLEGKVVVVIDDVTTTGATFSEARRALKEAGTKKIICLAVAH